MPSTKKKITSPSAKSKFKQEALSLGGIGWEEKSEQYCDYRLDGSVSVPESGWVRIKQYTNGTLFLEASSDALLGLISGEPVQPSLDGMASSTPAKPSKSGKPSGDLNMTGTYIGTDESGKGDYFGPLVIAGVLVTDQTAPVLRELGVDDSKALTPKKIDALYQAIIDTVGTEAISVVEIGPFKYNQLYKKFKQRGQNLNHLLAWGHATCIENLLERHPDCKQAVADQFGNERYILSQMKDKGKQIDLKQTPRAEANIAVAAASVVARWRFVEKIRTLSNKVGVELPLGASAKVKSQARLLVSDRGADALAEVAKLHFKTTDELAPGHVFSL